MKAHTLAGPSVPAITFWGGAREVTGSMHLVEVAGNRVLLDCGMVMERGADRRNRSFPFDPYQVDAVVISHAHIDHCGNLPNLVRQGYGKPIHCTPATRDLLSVMLTDSAKIHQEDAHHINAGRQPDEPWVEPLYTYDDVHRTLSLIVDLPYDQTREILPGVHVQLLEAGHVLGSAMVSLRFTGNGRESRLLFTGDLGRPNMPILRNPAPLPEADLVVSESTYGGQKHDPIDRMAESLRVLIRQTVDRGGKVLIPAFSLGRTQVVVHTLQELRQRGHLPEVPIFVDSPLAGDIAGVFRRHPECLSEQGIKELAGPVNFLEGHLLTYIKTVEESKQINSRKEPCIIVASSGMGEGGRILHHLKHSVDDPRCTVILVSYQAKETLGWRLLEHKPTVRFLGREWNKWANVVSLKGFSSHADHQDIVNSLAPLAGKVAKLRFVHGDVEASAKLAKDMRALGFADVAIPQQGDTLNFGD